MTKKIKKIVRPDFFLNMLKYRNLTTIINYTKISDIF